MEKKKRILVCPLDWGLGHATRCIPIIRELQNQGAEVIIAADKRPMGLLKNEFPTAEFIVFPGYEISYPGNGNMALQMFKQMPKIISGIYKENQLLQEIIKKHNIDGVVSDNRYGLWSTRIPCIFMTHQIMIKCPGYFKLLEPVLYTINRLFMSRYSQCWIPDFEGSENLSGDLSHEYALPQNTFFIGPLSRFVLEDDTQKETHFDLLVLLSGPEPQRSIFEYLILKQLLNTELKVLMIRGIPNAKSEMHPNKNIELKSHLNAGEMQEAILRSDFILSRPGYSTIMDVVALHKKAAFVPTPGQTEQKYLAAYHQAKGSFHYQQQHEFNLETLLVESANYKGMDLKQDTNALKNRVTALLVRLS